MTSVVIVDDHQLFRAGVRAELAGLVDVLGDAATVEDAVRMIAELEPDVVLLDVHMPGGGGLEVIRQSAPAQRFLALSVSDAPEDVIAIIRTASSTVAASPSTSTRPESSARTPARNSWWSSTMTTLVIAAPARPRCRGRAASGRWRCRRGVPCGRR